MPVTAVHTCLQTELAYSPTKHNAWIQVSLNVTSVLAQIGGQLHVRHARPTCTCQAMNRDRRDVGTLGRGGRV